MALALKLAVSGVPPVPPAQVPTVVPEMTRFAPDTVSPPTEENLSRSAVSAPALMVAVSVPPEKSGLSTSVTVATPKNGKVPFPSPLPRLVAPFVSTGASFTALTVTVVS